MDSSKLQLKIYLASDAKLPPASVIAPVFHAWIQAHELSDHALIDVADYAHVPNGPGLVLVADQANIYLDELDNRPGLTYQRKRPIDGSLADRIRYTFATTIRIAAMLEADINLQGAVKFNTREFSFKVNDRLDGPNNAETWRAVEPAIKSIVAELYGNDGAAIEFMPDRRRLFEARVVASQPSELKSLVGKLDLSASVS